MLRLALDISTAAIRCVSGFWHLVFLRILSEPKAREDLLILIQFLVTALLAFSLHNVSVRESYLKKKNLSANSTFCLHHFMEMIPFPQRQLSEKSLSANSPFACTICGNDAFS